MIGRPLATAADANAKHDASRGTRRATAPPHMAPAARMPNAQLNKIPMRRSCSTASTAAIPTFLMRPADPVRHHIATSPHPRLLCEYPDSVYRQNGWASCHPVVEQSKNISRHRSRVQSTQYSCVRAPVSLYHDMRSPPSCIPRPACLAALWSPRMPGLALGCRKLSKFRCRRDTVWGVLIVPGVLGHGRCPGLGVILTKSEKSKF